jgi:DNA-binding transcriptional LysR family regulator
MQQLKFNHLVKALKFYQLRLLIEIAEQGSILRAAERMNTTQSSATKALARLEATLGIQLFVRRARGMELSEFGMQLLEHSKIIVNQLHLYVEEVDALRSGTLGKVTIGTLIAATANLLPDVIAELADTYPNLRISVVEGTGDKLINALETGEIDVIVGRLNTVKSGTPVAQHYLYDDPINLVCGPHHPLVCASGPLSLADLLDYRWILPPKGTGLRIEIERSFARKLLSLPAERVESVSLMTNINLLTRSEFIGALPSQVVQPMIEMNRLHVLPVELDSTLAPVGYMVRETEAPPPSLNLFLRQLEDSAKRLYRLAEG